MIQTKRQLINRAFAKIGKNPSVIEIEDEEYVDALMELEAMMDAWADLNIQVGWPSSSNPNIADLDTVTDLPSRAISAVWTNLVLKIAPEYGVQATRTNRAQAKMCYTRLLAHYAKPFNRAKQSMPSGAGNKSHGRRHYHFLPETRRDGAVLPERQDPRFIND